MLKYVAVLVSTVALAACQTDRGQPASSNTLDQLEERCLATQSKDDCDRYLAQRAACSTPATIAKMPMTIGIIMGALGYWSGFSGAKGDCPGILAGAAITGQTTPSRGAASRIFSGPHQYPPKEFAAYGIVAFRSRPSVYDRNRHLMMCNAYVAALAHVFELGVPSTEQMATVWPVYSDALATSLNQRAHFDMSNYCITAVDTYGFSIAQRALKDARYAGIDVNTMGPLLLAWSPSTDKGKRDALVLVSDLSDVTTYYQALAVFLAWSRDIERDPTLWGKGWNLEALRMKIQQWADKYGTKCLALFGKKE